MKKIYSVLSATIVLIGCGVKPSSEAVNKELTTATSNIVLLTKEQAALAQLKLEPIQMGKMKGFVQLNGVVDVLPTGIASVSIPMGGYVQDINLIPGTYVKKGQVLATVKDPGYVQLQEQYLSAKAKMIYLQQDMDRQKALLTQEAVSKKTFQQLQSEFNSISIQLKALSEQLKLINIQPESLTTDKMTSLVQLTAPISGYVTKVNINRGKYVTPADILLEIMDPNDIHAAITIYEQDIAGFKVNLRFVSREDLLKIRSASLTYKFNKRTRQRAEEVDSAKFLENYAERAIAGWTGLKIKHLPSLLPVDISGMNPEEAVEFSEEDAIELLKNSPVFDQFVTDTLNDFEQFSLKKKEDTVKN